MGGSSHEKREKLTLEQGEGFKQTTLHDRERKNSLSSLVWVWKWASPHSLTVPEPAPGPEEAGSVPGEEPGQGGSGCLWAKWCL